MLKKEAQRVADLWETASQRKKSAQRIRAVFSEIYQDIYGQSLPVTSMKGFADLWVNEKNPSTAPATQLAYEKTVVAFVEHLGPQRAEADIADVSRTDIVAFRDSLYARRLASDTVNRYIKILRMLFKAAQRDRFILENPVEHVEPVKHASNARRRPFTIAEIQSVLCGGGSSMAKPHQIRPLYRTEVRGPCLVNLEQHRSCARRTAVGNA